MDEPQENILEKFKGSVAILQGIFKNSFFDYLRDSGQKDIFILEGRPSLDAAENSCRELIKREIKPTLIADNMVGFMFYKNLVKEVWVSYQTADEEGVLCHVGGLVLGVLGKKHNIPVHAYPGEKTLALLGHEKEIFHFNGLKVAPAGIKGYVPLAEWVPRKYITKIYED